eukprot:COSAG04_NODE_2077_length_4851_cov_6.312921_6_plen_43_part_00
MSGEENGREYEDEEECACRLNAGSKACCFQHTDTAHTHTTYS